ncbi:GRB2-associated-binding protein 2 [Cricetulus griseus]|uniref:GRB2-associated-binding protein 2 n=1 Tax=Cricetulus griseus TaxID=10029 RepID=A0A061I2L6_CRIGR|nr:GRB2-associated-binding protein 2 [Cricetulus griseus]
MGPGLPQEFPCSEGTWLQGRHLPGCPAARPSLCSKHAPRPFTFVIFYNSLPSMRVVVVVVVEMSSLEGWLEKLSPEKKLGRYAWKKCWFILRSGKMCGDPDVLEYYKNEHSKKPLGIINLNFCMQLDVALTFNKQELQKSFMFDIIINELTFYLVAETETDMNRWVQSICQICGFSQTKESTDNLRNLSSVSHNLCSSPAEFSSSSQPLLRAGSAADSEDVYTFKAPRNTLCKEFGDLLVESAIAPPPQHHKTPHSSQYCRSISNTDSRDSEENYVPMQNPKSSSPVPSGTNSPDPKKSTGNVNYIALDFQPVSQSPHCKPSTSSVASDEKGEYVQVDKEKTQALQRPYRNGQRCGNPQDPPKMPSYDDVLIPSHFDPPSADADCSVTIQQNLLHLQEMI